jgi:hypothetical protein
VRRCLTSRFVDACEKAWRIATTQNSGDADMQDALRISRVKFLFVGEGISGVCIERIPVKIENPFDEAAFDELQFIAAWSD